MLQLLLVFRWKHRNSKQGVPSWILDDQMQLQKQSQKVYSLVFVSSVVYFCCTIKKQVDGSSSFIVYTLKMELMTVISPL